MGKEEQRAYHTGTIPVSMNLPGKEIGAAMSELFSGYEEILAPVPSHVSDQDMECGGRTALHERLKMRAMTAELEPLKCGSCAVNSVCVIGQARG